VLIGLDCKELGESVAVDELHIRCGICKVVRALQIGKGKEVLKRMRKTSYFKRGNLFFTSMQLQLCLGALKNISTTVIRRILRMVSAKPQRSQLCSNRSQRTMRTRFRFAGLFRLNCAFLLNHSAGDDDVEMLDRKEDKKDGKDSKKDGKDSKASRFMSECDCCSLSCCGLPSPCGYLALRCDSAVFVVVSV
jgi:hypothetical protein